MLAFHEFLYKLYEYFRFLLISSLEEWIIIRENAHALSNFVLIFRKFIAFLIQIGLYILGLPIVYGTFVQMWSFLKTLECHLLEIDYNILILLERHFLSTIKIILINMQIYHVHYVTSTPLDAVHNLHNLTCWFSYVLRSRRRGLFHRKYWCPEVGCGWIVKSVL